MATHRTRKGTPLMEPTPLNRSHPHSTQPLRGNPKSALKPSNATVLLMILVACLLGPVQAPAGQRTSDSRAPRSPPRPTRRRAEPKSPSRGAVSKVSDAAPVGETPRDDGRAADGRGIGGPARPCGCGPPCGASLALSYQSGISSAAQQEGRERGDGHAPLETNRDEYRHHD